MSNYYFSQQPTILKQHSQILSPLPLQQSNYTIIRSTLTDRAPQDIKNHHEMLSPVTSNMPVLSREGSFKQLHENTRPAPPTVVQSRSSGGIENQRTFSDYQISPGVRVEEQMLPVGGGYNISSKIGERIKNKTDLHKSSSKGTLNGSELNKAPSIRYVQCFIEGDRGQFARIENIVEIINLEIAKINERVNIHEQKIERMERSGKKGEEGSESVFSTPQMQEINKILSLVQKSEQRDDYRKAMKMIEELRTTILELNTEIRSISEDHSSLPANQDIQMLKKQLQEVVNVKKNEIKQTSQMQVKELAKRLIHMEENWKQSNKNHEAITSTTSSVKKFQGKMTTFHYQQKLIPSNSQPNPHTLSTGITKTSISIPQKQNAPTTLILTSKTYYIDSSGYLMDKNKYYLLNQRNEQIRLSQKEIQLLRKHNIL